MRDIKFRAYVGKIVPVSSFYLMCSPNGKYTYHIFCGRNEEYLVNEIYQYTGLKDKNEVEIYEGDIVRYEYSYGFGEYKKECSYKGDVFYKDGIFYVRFKHLHSHSSDLYAYLCEIVSDFMPEEYSCEIVGNIHESVKEL